MSLSETSNLATQAAILGQNTANGDGIVEKDAAEWLDPAPIFRECMD